MPITVQKTGGELTVDLEGAVTIRHAQEMAEQIGEHMDGVVSVTVGTTRLRDVDTSILQLLCSLRKTVQGFRLESPSREFVAAVDRSGLRLELLGAVREGA